MWADLTAPGRIPTIHGPGRGSPSIGVLPAEISLHDRMHTVETSRLKELIELMDRNQLEELEVVDGDQRIRLRKRPEANRAGVSMAAIPAAGALPGTSGSQGEELPAEPGIDPELTIQSPMVGTFYRSPGPGTEPFVEVGDQIQEGQVLCIVEAMKVMNEVKSDRAGVVATVLVDDGNPVEFGQPLFLFS